MAINNCLTELTERIDKHLRPERHPLKKVEQWLGGKGPYSTAKSDDSELLKVQLERDELQRLLDKFERHMAEIQTNVKVLTTERDQVNNMYEDGSLKKRHFDGEESVSKEEKKRRVELWSDENNEHTLSFQDTSRTTRSDRSQEKYTKKSIIELFGEGLEIWEVHLNTNSAADESEFEQSLELLVSFFFGNHNSKDESSKFKKTLSLVTKIKNYWSHLNDKLGLAELFPYDLTECFNNGTAPVIDKNIKLNILDHGMVDDIMVRIGHYLSEKEELEESLRDSNKEQVVGQERGVHNMLGGLMFNILKLYKLPGMWYSGNNKQNFKVAHDNTVSNIIEYQEERCNPDLGIMCTGVGKIQFEICVAATCSKNSTLNSSAVCSSHVADPSGDNRVSSAVCGQPMAGPSGDNRVSSAVGSPPVADTSGDIRVSPEACSSPLAGPSGDTRVTQSPITNPVLRKQASSTYPVLIRLDKYKFSSTSRKLPTVFTEKFKSGTYIRDKLYGQMVYHLVSSIASGDTYSTTKSKKPPSKKPPLNACGFFVWQQFLIPVRLKCQQSYADIVFHGKQTDEHGVFSADNVSVAGSDSSDENNDWNPSASKLAILRADLIKKKKVPTATLR